MNKAFNRFLKYQNLREKGICTACEKEPAKIGFVKCGQCLDYFREHAKTWRKKPEIKSRTSKMRRERYRTDNKFAESQRQSRKRYYHSSEQQIKRQKIKDAIFNHYGNICACCGENKQIFLTVDHVNGNGTKHRRAISGRSGFAGGYFYQWLIKNNYPQGFQILCYNCNMAKRTNPSCPHQANK